MLLTHAGLAVARHFVYCFTRDLANSKASTELRWIFRYT